MCFMRGLRSVPGEPAAHAPILLLYDHQGAIFFAKRKIAWYTRQVKIREQKGVPLTVELHLPGGVKGLILGDTARRQHDGEMQSRGF